jgi:hypothetical protein
MGIIKTALEIALEKTKTVKSDKSSIDQFEAKQRGKKLANAFLEDGIDLSGEIKKTPEAQKESLKQGIFDVLVCQIALPAPASGTSAKKDGNDDKKIEVVGKGLQTVIDDKNFTVMYKQLTQVYSQYLNEASNYEQAISQQYAPKLRQKEEELSRRLGREVRIDPFQDPEFVAFYNQHMGALKGNYESVVEQAKEEAKRMFGL